MLLFLRRTGAVAVLATILVAPAVALVTVLVIADDAPAGVDRPSAPLVVTPTEQADSGMRSAIVTVSFNTAQSLLGSGGEGRITEVFIKPGDTVTVGNPIYSVNGITRIADASPIPYYRNLSLRAVGSDVAALNALLAGLGYKVDSTSDTFNADTRTAVRALRSELGEVRPSDIFTPDLVVWLPGESIVLDEVVIAPDYPAPAAGAAIAKAAPTVAAATMVLADGAAIPDALEGGPITETLSNTRIGELVDNDGDVQLNIDGLRIAGNALGLGEDAAVDARLDTTVEQLIAQVLLVVPATAVTTDPTGTIPCIWRPSGSGWAPMTVEVASAAQPGSVAIAGPNIGPEFEILANPTDILTEVTCPSSS